MRRELIAVAIALQASGACSGPTYDLPDIAKPPTPAKLSARLREPVAWRLSPQDAESILVQTRMLVLGERSRQTQAFNVTLEQSDARRRFLLVAGRGQLAGQLYALAALRSLDRAEASQLAARLAQIRNAVMVFQHGIAEEQAAAELVPLVSDAAVLAGLKQLKQP
jgi:hypothetical protein